MSWEEWKALMTGHYTGHLFPEKKTKQNGNVEDRILFVQSLVTDSGVKGNLIFPIRSEGIKNLMRDAYISQDGWAYLLDETNEEIILTVPAADGSFEKVPSSVLENGQEIQEIELNGKTVEVIRVDSDHLGMTYISVLDVYKRQVRKYYNKLQEFHSGFIIKTSGSRFFIRFPNSNDCQWLAGNRKDLLQLLYTLHNRCLLYTSRCV